MIIHFYVVLYLAIGLTVYFTIPNRKALSLAVTLPFIIAWLPISIGLLVGSDKPKKE